MRGMRKQGTAPKTWNKCKQAITRKFSTNEAKDDVLKAQQGLKLKKGEIIQKYMDKFWDR